MADADTKMCRICLTDSRDDNITDSSSYAKFFIDVMSLKVLNEKLLLCLWCKAALRRAIALFTLALESDKILHDKIPTDIPIKPISSHTLTYIHNTHIDIPPFVIEYQDDKAENITVKIEEITNPLLDNDEDENNDEIQDNDEILFKSMSVKSTDISNEESFSTEIIEHEFLENENVTKKINRNEFDYSELKFEVKYLNLEQQLKGIELKKLKYKDSYFQCEECGMGFTTSDIFEEHKIRHTELSGPHKCPICALHFQSQNCLSQHTLTHRRQFKCLLCSSVFTKWSHCVGHRYKCGAVEELVACVQCGKIFGNEYALKIHMNVHKTEKKYCCQQCDKKFGSKQRLTVHIRTHSGVKPFSCPQCALSFATRSNLRAHRSVHDHTTPFYCVECHTYYKTAKSLRRHFNESAKHAGLKDDMYPCKMCTKQFSTEKSLNHHFSTRHGMEHRCSHCDKTFSNNSNLNKHIKCIHTAK